MAGTFGPTEPVDVGDRITLYLGGNKIYQFKAKKAGDLGVGIEWIGTGTNK